MLASISSLKLPAAQPVVALYEQLPAGRLIEIAGGAASAQMTTAVACLRFAQARGETTAWVQPQGGSLFPPDLAESGIDLDALLIVHVPKRAGAYALAKTAELLLRSGAFGMVVLDLAELPMLRDTAWQGRLLGLVREHHSQLVLLSDGTHHGSLGPLISLCIAPERTRVGRGAFSVEHRIRKDKSGLLGRVGSDLRRGPKGLL